MTFARLLVPNQTGIGEKPQTPDQFGLGSNPLDDEARVAFGRVIMSSTTLVRQDVPAPTRLKMQMFNPMRVVLDKLSLGLQSYLLRRYSDSLNPPRAPSQKVLGALEYHGS